MQGNLVPRAPLPPVPHPTVFVSPCHFRGQKKERYWGQGCSEKMDEDESAAEEVSKTCLPPSAHFPEFSRLLNNLVRGFPKICKPNDWDITYQLHCFLLFFTTGKRLETGEMNLWLNSKYCCRSTPRKNGVQPASQNPYCKYHILWPNSLHTITNNDQSQTQISLYFTSKWEIWVQD